MDENIFIEILKQSYLLFRQDNLNEKSFLKMINNLEFVPYDSNLSFLNLREMLIIIYDSTPYFDFLKTINKFKLSFYEIFKDHKSIYIPKQDRVINLSPIIIKTIFDEIFTELKDCIDIELTAHLCRALNCFYNNGETKLNESFKNAYDNSEDFNAINESLQYSQITRFSNNLTSEQRYKLKNKIKDYLRPLINEEIQLFNKNVYSGSEVFIANSELLQYSQSTLDFCDSTTKIDLRNLSSEQHYYLKKNLKDYLRTLINISLNDENFVELFEMYYLTIIDNLQYSIRIDILAREKFKYLKECWQNQRKKSDAISEAISLTFTQKDSND